MDSHINATIIRFVMYFIDYISMYSVVVVGWAGKILFSIDMFFLKLNNIRI